MGQQYLVLCPRVGELDNVCMVEAADPEMAVFRATPAGRSLNLKATRTYQPGVHRMRLMPPYEEPFYWVYELRGLPESFTLCPTGPNLAAATHSMACAVPASELSGARDLAATQDIVVRINRVGKSYGEMVLTDVRETEESCVSNPDNCVTKHTKYVMSFVFRYDITKAQLMTQLVTEGIGGLAHDQVQVSKYSSIRGRTLIKVTVKDERTLGDIEAALRKIEELCGMAERLRQLGIFSIAKGGDATP